MAHRFSGLRPFRALDTCANGELVMEKARRGTMWHAGRRHAPKSLVEAHAVAPAIFGRSFRSDWRLVSRSWCDCRQKCRVHETRPLALVQSLSCFSPNIERYR